MTRKDYIKIAKIIKDNTSKKLEICNALNKRGVISELCIVFKEDNNNFDNNRFINACYDDEDRSDVCF
jgi:hypothetical protein